MNKKKKILLSFASIATTIAPIISIVSCDSGKNSNEWQNSKQIVIAVDGKQQGMYDAVITEFAKTNFGQNGYKIKTIQKDAFGAIDLTTQLGYGDENVPDLIYAPQDRVTALIQQKAAMPWTNALRDRMLTLVKATPSEKEWAIKYGSIVMDNKNTFFAIPHNKEGILYMSSNNYSDAYAETVDPITKQQKTMQDLVKQGTAFFRLQDFWYGNGLFGATADAEQKSLSKFLYKKDGRWSSGFLDDGDNHVEFMSALNTMEEMWYSMWVKAYGDASIQDRTQYTISPGEAQVLLSSDINKVQNKMYELLNKKTNGLKYGIIGTWDMGSAAKQGIKTFFNIDKANYIQAPGSWSYVINARNNGASSQRIKAIEKVLELIYTPEIFAKYFDVDAKVPIFSSIQEKVKQIAANSRQKYNTDLTRLATSNGYDDSLDLIRQYNVNAASVGNIFDLNVVDDWSIDDGSHQPLGDNLAKNQNLKKLTDVIADKIAAMNLIGMTSSVADQIPYTTFQKSTGIRNLTTVVFGKSDLTQLNNGGTWLIPDAWFKSGITKDKSWLQQGKANVRLTLEKAIGVNGDSESSKNAMINKFKKGPFEDVVAQYVQNVQDFAKKYAQTPGSDDDIKIAVQGYLSNFYNQSLIAQFVNEYKKAFNVAKFNKKNGTVSTITYEQVKNAMDKYSASGISNYIISTVSSNQPFDGSGDSSKLGIMEYQNKRLDHYNPQFSAVWALWNEQTFGNATFLKSIPRTSTLTQFKSIVTLKLQELYQQKVDTLQATPGTTDRIKF